MILIVVLALDDTAAPYRGDLTGFAAHHDGDVATLTAAPVRAFLGEIAGQAPSTRKRKRATVASFCKWAVLSRPKIGSAW